MRSLKIFFVLVVILAAVVSAYVAYAPYRPQEDEVFELNLRALAVGGGEGEDEGEAGGFGPSVACFNVVDESYNPDFYLEVRRCIDCELVKASSASTQSSCNL